MIATVALAVLAFGSVPTAANASADFDMNECKSVDEFGNLLPGGAYAGLSCTRFNNDPDWTCISLNDYSWFEHTNDAPSFDSLRKSGVSNKFTCEIDMEGTWAEPIQHYIVLQ